MNVLDLTTNQCRKYTSVEGLTPALKLLRQHRNQTLMDVRSLYLDATATPGSAG